MTNNSPPSCSSPAPSPPAKSPLGPVPPGHRTNLETIKCAASAGDLAIMTARRVADNTIVTLLVAVAVDPEGMCNITPLAEMFGDINPFEAYETE